MTSPQADDLYSVAGLSRILRHWELPPARRFGQNFLLDRDAIGDEIAAGDAAGGTILEIGHGLGSLTIPLAAVAASVVAVDIDPRCSRVLRTLLPEAAPVQTVCDDVRNIDPGKLGIVPPYTVMGNIPYNLTGSILRYITQLRPLPRRAVLLVQKEVGERLCASPGRWGLSTVALQSVGKPRAIRVVPAACFYPQPKVDSLLFAVEFSETVDDDMRSLVLQLARGAFSMRRKRISNSLQALLPAGLPAKNLLETAGLDPGLRPEALGMPEWTRLADAWRQLGLPVTGR